MNLKGRNTAIAAIAITVVVMGPLIAYNYMDSKPVQIVTTPGIVDFNFSGNYNSYSSGSR